MNEKNAEWANNAALWYAWGRADAGETVAQGPSDVPSPFGFAQQYARTRVAYDSGAAVYCPSVQDAYKRWQETDGKSVLPA